MGPRNVGIETDGWMDGFCTATTKCDPTTENVQVRVCVCVSVRSVPGLGDGRI